MTYRRDIDGLRAIAVLAVVLYHAGVPWLAGGFAGVDVFFVISGYLITGLIAERVRTGTFSIIDFYERRARRLLPALFAMLAVVSALSLWLLFPLELKELNFHLRGAILFASNFTLAEETNYFARAAETKPLLHTWSLAVEEQFYLVFPLLLIVAARWGARKTVWIVAGLAAASLISAIVLAPIDPAVAFFMPQYRFWELAVGALLALGAIPERWRTSGGTAVSGIFGLVFIAASMGPLPWSLPVPGLGVAIPVLGTALLIWSGSGPAARLLSTAPFVATGLISYSLYLWHWPLLVFLPIWLGREAEVSEVAAAVALSGLIAVLSWRFIEQPVRHRQIFAVRPRLFAASTVGGLALIAVTLAGDWTDGLPGRFSKQTAAALSVQDDWLRGKAAGCLRRAPRMVRTGDPAELRRMACKIGDPAAPVDFILWGDSHASALQPGLETAAIKAGRRGLVLTHSSCAPLPGYPRNAQSKKMKGCGKFNLMVREMLARGKISTVVLGARWRAIEAEDTGLLPDLVTSLDADGLDIIMVGQVPELRHDLPTTVARALRVGGSLPLDRPITAAQQNVTAANAIMEAVAGTSLLRIDPVPWLCPDDLCPSVVGDDLVYADQHHLSAFGAHYLVTPLQQALEATRPDR